MIQCLITGQQLVITDVSRVWGMTGCVFEEQ